MAQTTAVHRPSASADYRAPSKHRGWGIGLAVVGLILATVTLINNIASGNLVLAGREGEAAVLQAWSFSLTTVAFATAKVAIAVVLIGILGRLWLRVESVKAALPQLRPATEDDAPIRTGEISSRFGKATVGTREPAPLPIHRMAQRMWGLSLVMGIMLVAAGFVVSLFQVGSVGVDPGRALAQSAWTQGLQFLGEGFILSGIAFLLGTILAALRSGGAQVQESLGLAVKTLKMPGTAKLFVALMMLGLLVEVFQFVVYIVAANTPDPAAVQVLFTWLGPVREVGLGLILAGITLALATIAKALGFQFDRIVEIVTTGR